MGGRGHGHSNPGQASQRNGDDSVPQLLASHVGRVDAAARDAWGDAARSQSPAQHRGVVGLVTMEFVGALPVPARLIGGTASMSGMSWVALWALAAERRAANRVPLRSTTRWSLERGLPRSVGFGSVCLPAFWFCPDAQSHRARPGLALEGGPPLGFGECFGSSGSMASQRSSRTSKSLLAGAEYASSSGLATRC